MALGVAPPLFPPPSPQIIYCLVPKEGVALLKRVYLCPVVCESALTSFLLLSLSSPLQLSEYSAYDFANNAYKVGSNLVCIPPHKVCTAS